MKSWSEAAPGSAAAPEFVPTGIPQQGFVPLLRGTTEAPTQDDRDAERAQDIEAQLTEAYERGLSAARAEAPPYNPADIVRVFGALSAAAAETERLARGEASRWSGAAIDLALLIAERIVRARFAVDRSALEVRVAAAIDQLGDEHGARVLLATPDLTWLESSADSELVSLRAAHALEIESDPALEPGEFRVEQRGALVDGSVAAMLDRFREGLHEVSVSSALESSEGCDA